MKKILVLIFSFVLAVCCFACVKQTVRFDGKEVAKITLGLGGSGQVLEIEEESEIKALTENIGGLTFQKKDGQRYDGFLYSMKWYDGDGKVLCAFSILNEGDIRYDGAIYFAKGTIDLGLIEEILNPYYQKPMDSELAFWITQDVASVDFSSYRSESYLLGAVEYTPATDEEGGSGRVAYLVSAYPDYADGGKFVTRIRITDTKIKVLGGLTITASVAEWSAALRKLRFDMVEGADPLDSGTEYKEVWISRDGKLSVTLIKGTAGYAMYIYAAVTNREGLI